MDLRLLRALITAVNEGTISKAAQRLHLTQSALSRQIKALEDDLGVSLLERGAHSFSVTAAGTILVAEGRQLLEQAAALERRVRGQGRSSTLRIGYSPSLTAGLLSQAMEAFSQRHPLVRYTLSDLGHQEMIAQLRQKELDVIVTVPPGKNKADVRWEPLTEETWGVALPRHHLLARKTHLRPADLKGQPLIIYQRAEYPGYWLRIEQWFQKHELALKVASECDGVASLLSAVEAGLGVALMPTRAARLFPQGVAFKSLPDGPQPIKISAGWLDSPPIPAILTEFIASLKAPSGERRASSGSFKAGDSQDSASSSNGSTPPPRPSRISTSR
jgi:LysR family transcriptional regulator, benzoate and cis,cis-muconate-responsive activator of ben and cat genes